MTLSAFAVGALVCVGAFLALCPFIPEISGGVRVIVALRAVRSAVALFGHLFLGVTRAIDWARAALGAFHSPAAIAAALILPVMLVGARAAGDTIAAMAGYVAPLAREPGDVVYLPTLAVRADGRLALAEGVTVAAAAATYAGPGDYWAAACRATLPGWRAPIDWRSSDATGATIWRASISDRGVVEISGLAPAEAAPMRALLEALALAVACAD
jgi:hypothetical protein